MYRARGTYQIIDLELADFTFYIFEVAPNVKTKSTRIAVIYNDTYHRDVWVEQELDVQQAIDHVKQMYAHDVLQEQLPSSVFFSPFTHLDQVDADMAFGLWMVKKYLAENRSLTLTATQVLELTVAFEQVKKLFDVGSIETGLYLLMQIPTEGNGGPVAWTEQRRLAYIQIIQQYIQTGQYDAL